MKVRKPSNARLGDDGYNDCKAGKVALHRDLFESLVDYHIYMNGYNRASEETKPVSAKPDTKHLLSDSLWIDHNIWPNGSGCGYYHPCL